MSRHVVFSETVSVYFTAISGSLRAWNRAKRRRESTAINGPQITGVNIRTAGAELLSLARPTVDSTAVRVHAENAESCRLPRLVDAPELDPARRIAAALESSRIDPPFHNALPIALWLMEGAD